MRRSANSKDMSFGAIRVRKWSVYLSARPTSNTWLTIRKSTATDVANPVIMSFADEFTYQIIRLDRLI